MGNENIVNQSTATGFGTNEETANSFLTVLRFVRRFLFLLLACTILGLGAGLGVAYVKDKPVYTQSKSVILIAKIDSVKTTTTTNISLTKKYLDNTKEIIVTPIFIDKANEIYQRDYSGSGEDGIGAGAIGVAEGGGMILTISYTDLDADIAAKKLDAFLDAAEEVFKNEVKITADEVKLARIDNVATLNTTNGFMKYVIVGFFGGLLVGVLIALLYNLLDNTVNSGSELERITGATIVAYIDDVLKG